MRTLSTFEIEKEKLKQIRMVLLSENKTLSSFLRKCIDDKLEEYKSEDPKPKNLKQ